MRKVLDWLGGRKFVFALVVFLVGTVMGFLGHLTMEWVALSSLVLGIFNLTNAAVHRGYAAAEAHIE